MVKTDCIHFPLDRPCRYQKDEGATCPSCNKYIPVTAPDPRVTKIIIIKLGAMGDVLRTTFLLPGLKEKYPGAEITWVVSPQSVDILASNPHLERIWANDAKTPGKLVIERFDVCVNLDLAPESLALATLALADRKTGYWLDGKRRIQCSNAAARQWLDLSAYDSLKKKNQDTYQYWMARICELPRPDYEIYTPLLPASVNKANGFAKAHRLNGATVVGINPGAGSRWRLKKWTDAGFVSLIKHLDKSGCKVLLLGGPEETALLERLVKRSHGKAVNAGTTHSLPDFFALVNLCALLVTGDTMALHAALGLKKMAVAIFGPTSSAEIEMYGRGVKIVSPAKCVCCYRPSCQYKPDCMQLIRPQVVQTVVDAMLHQR